MPTIKNRETSFEKSKRERAEHAAEAKRNKPVESTQETKPGFRGGIEHVDRYLAKIKADI